MFMAHLTSILIAAAFRSGVPGGDDLVILLHTSILAANKLFPESQ